MCQCQLGFGQWVCLTHPDTSQTILLLEHMTFKVLRNFSSVLSIQIKFPSTSKDLSYSHWLPFSCCYALRLFPTKCHLRPESPVLLISILELCSSLQPVLWHTSRTLTKIVTALPCLPLLHLADFQLFSTCSLVDPANNCWAFP